MELKIQSLNIKDATKPIEIKNKRTKKRINQIISLSEKRKEQEYLRYLLSIF